MTIPALEGLYEKLSVGGYLIVDDYGNVAGCRQAVHDFRDRRGITDPLRPIDWAGVYWRRGGPAVSTPPATPRPDRALADG